MKDLRILVLSLAFAVVLTACSDPDGNFTGSEYMPDMAHSLAMEANTYNYYYYNTWDKESTISLAELAYPRVPAKGTVPRGYASAFLPGMKAPKSMDDMEAMRGLMVDSDAHNAISVPTSGSVPYYYDDSAEGRLAAMAGLTDNPFPITEAGMIRGAKLYNIFCGICHGAQGNGLGYIYDEDQNPNAKYPLAPASFLTDEFKAASNGRYYHAIMYGYNAMGAYKDKINYEERWQVIHFIRSLQAKDVEKEYNQDVNTLNPSFGTPLSQFDAMAARAVEEEKKEQMEEAAQLGDAQEGASQAEGQGQMRKK